MISIQRAKPEEVADVKKILSSTWTDTYGDFMSEETIQNVTSIWHSPENLKRQIENKDFTFLTAKEETGQIIGIATAREDNKIILLSRIYVLPDNQRQGVGQKLFSELLRYFPEAENIRLKVEKQNKKAQQFYSKIGFNVLEEKTEIVGNELLEVMIMEKSLI